MATNTESKNTSQNVSEENYTIIGKTSNRDNNDFSSEDEKLLDFSKNAKLIEAIQIEGTPFNKVKTDEGWFISIGQDQVTLKLTEKEVLEHEKELTKSNWKLLMAIIGVITKKTVALHHYEIMKWEENRLKQDFKNKQE